MARSSTTRRTSRAASPEEQESRCISLAYNLAEDQLRKGTASSQVITQFLKMGTLRERRELEKLELEKEQIKARTKAYQSADEIKGLYEEAIKSMREYNGSL